MRLPTMAVASPASPLTLSYTSFFLYARRSYKCNLSPYSVRCPLFSKPLEYWRTSSLHGPASFPNERHLVLGKRQHIEANPCRFVRGMRVLCAHEHTAQEAARKKQGKSGGDRKVRNVQQSIQTSTPEKSGKTSNRKGKKQTHAKTALSARNTRLRVCRNFLDAVGLTPLIYLRHASETSRCEIFGKCEFNNPGGSVKDRPAKYIIEQAERQGTLSASRPWIVEGSAGNTAIGLALASKEKGYRVVCVIPDNQTQDKKIEDSYVMDCETAYKKQSSIQMEKKDRDLLGDMLKVCGALIVEVPFQKVWHPDHFVAFSGRLARVLNASWGAQFDNLVRLVESLHCDWRE